jgi:competence protein ComEA
MLILLIGFGLVFHLFIDNPGTFASQGRTLPDGPGKVETQKLCTQCHELDKSIAPRQDKAGWQRTVEKMVAFGMTASDGDVTTVVEFLAKNYPADDLPPIRVNQATAIEFESGLGVRRSQATAIIRYREANGPFKTIDDLKKVPGIEAAKIDAKKDRLIFE